MPLKVTKIEPLVVRVPLLKPAAIANRRFTEREYTIVRMVTAEGVEGNSICIGAGTVPAHVNEFAPLIIGRDPEEAPRIWNDLVFATRHGRRGAPMFALSLLDNALWDLRAKVAGLPLYRLLGVARTEVHAYASGGVYVDGEGVTELAREYEQYAEAGFQAAKVRIGGLAFAEDVERVRVVRQALGPRVRLGIDANATLQAWDDAKRFLDAVEDCDIAWFEDPFHAEAFENFRKLSTISSVPISTGESESFGYAFAQWAATGIVDILQPDVTVVGGITEWLRVAGLAACFGKTVFPHWFPFVHIHLSCSYAGQAVRWVEYVPNHKIVNIDELFDEPYVPRRGVFRPSEKPGIGLSFDWDRVARYQV